MINGHGDDIHAFGNIKINFSSNVYGHFSHEGLMDHLHHSLHLITNYPEPSAATLEAALAAHHGIHPDEVMVTNGATEAIYLIAHAFSNYSAIIQQPTFAEYADACNDCHGTSIMRWLCIPNNPTGDVTPRTSLVNDILSHPDDIFIIDASYAAYTTCELLCASDAITYPNVLMLHSMTKDYGVPGLRLGYITASHTLLDHIRHHRMPWSVNALAIDAGHYLLAHKADYTIPLDNLLQERKRIEPLLHAMHIATHPSDSHMLLCKLPHGTAAELKLYLAQEHGILIRDASNFQGLMPQHFRIAIQTPSENDELIKALSQWTSKS